MTAVLAGGLGFIGALVIHIIVWKIRVPKNTLPVFAVIFGGVYVAVLSLYPVDSLWAHLDEVGYWSFLYALLGLCYVLTYNGIVYDSPALTLVLLLAEAGDEGLSTETLRAEFSARPFIESRLDQLYRDGLVLEEDGVLHLAGSFQRMLILYDWIRLLFRLKKGGG